MSELIQMLRNLAVVAIVVMAAGAGAAGAQESECDGVSNDEGDFCIWCEEYSCTDWVCQIEGDVYFGRECDACPDCRLAD